MICVPEVEKGRYYTVQLVDMYTAKFGYIGSRATGNSAGCYMVAGPGWKGPLPHGIKKEFRSETEFVAIAVRTQLFGPSDLGNVRKVQAGYKAQTSRSFSASRRLVRPQQLSSLRSTRNWPRPIRSPI